jgi:23S rRNA (adenine1618-N6)-methyltransferase
VNNTTQKTGLHARNKYRFRYDFAALVAALPLLDKYVLINKYGDKSIDFANPDAVKTLNKALLLHHYGIVWDIPATYLCPPIPGRAEYIHQIADVLEDSNMISKQKQVKILDIGTGANCIYPIIGHQEYGWFFVGTDIDKISIEAAQKIINKNESLRGHIECRWQPSKKHIFQHIIQENDYFDCTICNPPFHVSEAEAAKGTQRKVNNLSKNKQVKPVRNFGGQNAELWCEGGEIAFISTMIEESIIFRNQCSWFSTLVSKSDNLDAIYQQLSKAKVSDQKTIHMQFGNKISRIVCWTFK